MKKFRKNLKNTILTTHATFEYHFFPLFNLIPRNFFQVDINLETRRKRGDLIQFYKVLNGHDHINWKNEPEKIVYKTAQRRVT